MPSPLTAENLAQLAASLKLPEEARQRKLREELAAYHTPRLTARLAASCAEWRRERANGSASNQ